MSIFKNTETLPFSFHKQHVDEMFYVIDNVICSRVTSLIVRTPFPRLIAARAILKSPDRKEEYANCVTVHDVYSVWSRLCNTGVLIHREVEFVLRANTWDYVEGRKSTWTDQGIGYEMRQFTEWLHHIKDTYTLVATEFTLADLDAKSAGTVDIIIKHTATGEYVIYDLKTCREKTIRKKAMEYKQQLGMYRSMFVKLMGGLDVDTVTVKILQVNKYNDDMSVYEKDEPIEDQMGSYNTYCF